MTKQTERRLRMIENKIRRKKCGSVYDEVINSWRRYKKLYSVINVAPVIRSIKGRKIQWLEHIREERKAIQLDLYYNGNLRKRDLEEDLGRGESM
ncbi:Hypothetical protein CINCED_3A012770 [Cinara cedri]|uniref:Uncharacterized protein n=1 Tax=Cinara cedri TaxID=506608 RepID=A0A5E4NP72_9HEMI|nr:Hypothetical protein CINCED_3A012770 [Cinara cedri]